MKQKNSYQRHMPHLFTILMLLLFPLLSMLPGISARAEGQVSDIANPAFTLTTTQGTSISTTASPNETTVLIFGHTGCSYTRSTLDSITACDWIKRSDVRVIFADCNLHTQEEVLAYEQGYQCPYITFCYDTEPNRIYSIMYEYGKPFGINGGKLPMIVLIDGNNKVQNLLSGTKTADEILAEIKKFADISGGGSVTPPSGSDTGFANFAYGLKNIDGTIVSTKANPNEVTVLLFGNTECAITKGTLEEIHKSGWVSQDNIRVIFADVQGHGLSDTTEFAQNFPGSNILFCHDESMLNWSFAGSYLKLYGYTGGTFPYVALIDQNNRIRDLTLGFQSETDIYRKIEEIRKTEPEPTPDPKPDPSVADVTKLKTAAYTAKSIKLTWQKVPGAKGYIIYQYSNSKKDWIVKKTLTGSTASYTAAKLTPATEYRFAVKAYIDPAGGTRITSKDYASLYTATAPNTVDFKVTPGKKKAVIKWNKVKGATSYTVYYKTNTQKSWKKLKSTKSLRYTKTRLKSGVKYTFTVKASRTYRGKTYTSDFRSKKVKIK